MTKLEMQQLIDKLTAENAKNIHLKEAVEAKDAEIAKLNLEVAKIANLEQAIAKNNHLKEAVEAKDAEIANLQRISENTLQDRLHELQQQWDAEKSKLQQETEFVVNVRDRRIAELNKLIFAYGDLLKGLEALTNTHLSLNKYMIDEIQK